MNENNNYSNNVTPYKATGNLNTAIGNPRVNINDTMNINIQNMATNTAVSQEPVNNSVQNPNNTIPVNNNVMTNNNNKEIVQNINNNINNNVSQISTSNNTVNLQNNISNTAEMPKVNKVYVSANNEPKKKKITLNLGPEFKIGLLIVVILLVFVFLLPMISDLFSGR